MQQYKFMLDSGASCNFIPYSVVEQLQLQYQNNKSYSVRLADGKIISTLGQVQLPLLLGDYKYNGTFHVLSGDVPLILGMQFLRSCTPQINWKYNRVTCFRNNRTYLLPTCQLGMRTDNSFATLPVENQETEPAIEPVLPKIDNFVCEQNQENTYFQQLQPRKHQNCHVSNQNQNFYSTQQQHPTIFKSQKQCSQCGKLFVGSDQYCYDCSDAIIEKFQQYDQYPNSQFQTHESSHIDHEVARDLTDHVGIANIPQQSMDLQDNPPDTECVASSATQQSALNLQDSSPAQIINDHGLYNRRSKQKFDNNNVELVTLKQFTNRKHKQSYKFVGLLQFDNNQPQEFLNFTHRATLGGGDDADNDANTQLKLVAQQQISQLKYKYPQVFSEPTYPVNRQNCPQEFQHSIPLVDENAAPPKRKLYPLDTVELEELKTQIKTFLDSGRIEPAHGAYGAPILFAKKKDGSLRMCIDYRALNAQTRNDVYPLPRPDELLQRLDGATIFSKIDLRDGYHQIPMRREDRVKTSFTCRYGTFQFTVMPFGLSTAPATFQRMMNTIFFEMLDKGVLIYLDDILVYSKTIEEHKKLLDRVFYYLNLNKLYLKEKKCSLFLEKINFLGHVISKDGVSMESGKVQVVQDWPTPQTVLHIQQFLGLCNYYRRFILRFSEVASPLTLLTRKKQKFIWESAQINAFTKLKQLLCSAPILRVFDYSLRTRVVCDASNFCIGGVLEQQDPITNYWHPVEYYSKRLSSAERNYSATDREYVAIRQCLERWRHFLIGLKFLILTDHVALTYIQSSANVSRRNARWLDFLSQYTFDIEHIKGRENVIADTLSRIPIPEPISNSSTLCNMHVSYGLPNIDDTLQTLPDHQDLHGIITIHENSTFLKQLQTEQEQSENTWYLKLVQQAKNNSNTYQYRNQLLCKLVRDTFCPVIPQQDSTSIQIILSDLHASALGGHLGFKKLLKVAAARFFWQNMYGTIKQFVRNCSTCQANKHSTQKSTGLLQPVENPSSPFEHITMDFVTHLPVSTRGYDAIFSIVDRFSRFCRFIPCHTAMSALDCADLFFEHWVCKYGMPVKIVSDRDARFTSSFWQELTKLLQCKVSLSTAYHPQTDGLTERFHRSIEQVLRCYCSGMQQQWCKMLAQCEFALNSTYQDAVQCAPFQVIHGFTPRIPLDTSLESFHLPAVQNFVTMRENLQSQVQSSLKLSQERMEKIANRARRDIQFQVKDMVWLSTKNLPLRLGTKKLAPIFSGPYEITDVVNPVAYKLELPPDWNIHNVFHVSQLKPCFGNTTREQELLVDGILEFEVEKILGHRVVRDRNQYLVKWKGYEDYNNTWLDELELGNAQEALQDFLSSKSRMTQTRRGSGVRVSR